MEYGIKPEEVEKWIMKNVKDTSDEKRRWTFIETQEKMKYEEWKIMMKDIKRTRKKNKKELEIDEFKDNALDNAISQVSSAELIGTISQDVEASTSLQRAGCPNEDTIEELPYQRNKESKNGNGGGEP